MSGIDLAVEDAERLGEEDHGDRPAVPDVLRVGDGVALEEGPQVDVLVPLRHADGEVAQLVRRDVDAAGEQAVALLRGERPIVPDDVAHRIGHRLLLSGRHRTPEYAATGSGQRVEGHGDTAEEAMADLANQLRAIRPDPNG